MGKGCGSDGICNFLPEVVILKSRHKIESFKQ